MNLEDHRAAYHADLLISKMVSGHHIGKGFAQQPPTARDANTGVLHQEPGARVGMSMSGRLLRYLGHPEGYGESFPWSRAFYELRWHCRRNHPSHRTKHYWRGSLCWSVVQLTVVRGFSPEDTALILLLDSPEPVLGRALRFIEESIDHQRHRAEKRAREDQGLAGPVNVAPRVAERHDMGGVHSSECPRCRRAA